jgi:RNA polymerase sigma-70 factor (ECF subfamily)
MTPEQERSFVHRLARQEPSAVQQFERDFLGPLQHKLAHMKLDAATLDEVRQRVRERLLIVQPNAATRIESYAGEGKLDGLVLVTATRIAVDLLRARAANNNKAAPLADELVQDGTADWLGIDAKSDPTLAAMKREALVAFKRAFETAVSQLEARERNLLRQHHLQGVSLDQLATVYQVHRATVVRWLALARDRVLEQTRKQLAISLSVDRRELDDVLALLESRLDASVERLLRSQSE